MNEIKSRIFAGIAWTSSGMLFKTFLQLLQLLILVRMLRPEDFGLVAITYAIIYCLQTLSESGISSVILHYKKISDVQRSTLFWLNICVAVLVGVVLMVFAKSIAAFFSEATLKELLMLSSVALILDALSLQVKAFGQKEMKFSVLAKIEVISALAAFCVAVSSALMGFGAFSLILGVLVSSFIGCVLAWLWLADGWRPELSFRWKEVRGMVRFGIYMMGTNLINTVNSQLDIWFLGRAGSSGAVGGYGVSKDINMRIVQVINPVVTRVSSPLFASFQDNNVELRNIYRQILRLIAVVLMPIYIGCFLYSDEVVYLMMGGEWIEYSSIFGALALWGLYRGLINPIGGLLIAKGQANRSFYWNVFIFLLLIPLLYSSSILGGVSMVAYMFAGLGLILYWPAWRLLVYPSIKLDFNGYFNCHFSPFLISLISVGGGRIIFDLCAVSEPWFWIVCLFLSGVLYLFITSLFNPKLVGDFSNFYRMLKK